MIFYRSVIRELTSVAFAVFSVLLAIMSVTQVIKLFDKAAEGALPTDAIVAMIAFTTLGYFGTLLSITLFISVLVVLTRIYRDHEMVVWLSAGLSPTAWVRPVLAFAVPLTVLIAAVSLYLGPWAQMKGNEYADVLKQREEISALSPGVFKESRNGENIYFVEDFSGERGAATNIFVQSTKDGKPVVLMAREGRMVTRDNGERYLVLQHGQRYEGEPGRGDWRTIEFGQYEIKITQNIKGYQDTRAKSMTTGTLLAGQTPDEKAELFWRVSLPVSALILALLAIPLSYYNPRSGQTFNLLIALFVYLIYYNLINLFQSMVGKDALGGWTGAVGLHLFMLALFVALLALRRKPLKLLLRGLRREAV